MKRKKTSKARIITQFANDIKELLQLDECNPVVDVNGSLWLRCKSGVDALDIPIGKKPLLDTKHDNKPVIKMAVIQFWTQYLQGQLAAVAND